MFTHVPARPKSVIEVEDEYAPGPPTHQSSMSVGNNRHQQYDERPAMGRGRYTPSEEQMAAAAARRQAPQQVESDLPAPQDWPGDLPVPEPVSGTLVRPGISVLYSGMPFVYLYPTRSTFACKC